MDLESTMQDVLRLVEMERAKWPTISARLRTSGVPLCEGEPDPPADPPSDPPAPPEGDPPADPPASDPDPRIQKANREAQRYREELRQAQARLKEIEDAQKSEQEKALERAEAAERRAAAIELELMRTRVASETGLPADLVDRLRGDTEDELREDAARLAELLKPTDPPAPGADLPRVPRGATTPKDMTVSPEEARRLAREDPRKFNELFEAGEITPAALTGQQ